MVSVWCRIREILVIVFWDMGWLMWSGFEVGKKVDKWTEGRLFGGFSSSEIRIATFDRLH